MVEGILQYLGASVTHESQAIAPSTPLQGQKRPAVDDIATPNTPSILQSSAVENAFTPQIDNLSEPAAQFNASRATSPALSSVLSLSGDVNSSQILPNATLSTNGPPQKRRRLSPAEKEALRIEREQKAKEKEARKVQREEEQRAKDEERRKKNEEREEKKREKELEKQQKEQVKQAKEQAKEDERMKKERAQPKLVAFFSKPAPTSTIPSSITSQPGSPIKAAPASFDAERRKSVSAEPLQSDVTAPASKLAPPEKKRLTDYQRYFLPFSIPSFTTVAPNNQFLPDEAELADILMRLDAITDTEHAGAATSPAVLKRDFRSKAQKCTRTSGVKVRSIKTLMASLHGSPNRPINLTEDGGTDDIEPLTLIRATTQKYLHFHEDVRPPYSGTYTKVLTSKQSRSLALNPAARTLPEVNYDYDSEAEWEEPEEGEDLDMDDDEEEEEDGDEDMDGFLDDEDDVGKLRRGPLIGDLIPVSTGLCWENASGKQLRSADSGEPVDLNDYKMGVILDPAPASISPFSTAYWFSEPVALAPSLIVTEPKIASLMNPPRLPLSSRPNASNSTVLNANLKANGTGLAGAAPKPPKRMIAPELMEDFKQEIEGSDLTKIALIEALKKRFPKQPKDAITNTLNAIAARVGDSNATKRWRLAS